MRTTPPGTSAPGPGWYADPQQTGGLRWWDGTSWTGYTQPSSLGRTPGPDRPTLGPGWSRLAMAVQVALVVGLLVELAWVGLDVWGWSLAESWQQDPAPAGSGIAGRYDTLTLVALVMLVLSYLTCGVLFITWLFQACRSDRPDASLLRYQPGWAIGGWFVPILNLFRPIQMVLDLRRATAGRPRGGVPLAWWWSYVVSGLVVSVATFMAPDDTTTDARYLEVLQRSLLVDAAGSALAAASGVLAVLVVRSTTRMVEASSRGVRPPVAQP